MNCSHGARSAEFKWTDRVTTVAEAIAVAESLTWSDAKCLAATAIEDAEVATFADFASRRLGRHQVELISATINLAAEHSASRDQLQIVGFWVHDDDPRAALWRAFRRATWEKAVSATIALGLAAAAGHPVLTRLPRQR